MPIVAYHFLTSPGRNYSFTSSEFPYVLDAAAFREHLEGLFASGYRTLRLADYVVGRELPARPVALTFDDGHLSCLEMALELLIENEATAAFFIPTDAIGQPERLAREQIVELSRLGMEIGSHGCSHRALTALTFAEMKDELKRSKQTLEDITGSQVGLLALPHGFGSRGIERAAREAGYEAICTSRFGLNQRQHGAYCLNRIGLKGPTAWVELESLLKEGSAPYRRELAVDRVKGLAKWVLQTHKRCD